MRIILVPLFRSIYVLIIFILYIPVIIIAEICFLIWEFKFFNPGKFSELFRKMNDTQSWRKDSGFDYWEYNNLQDFIFNRVTHISAKKL